MGTAVLAVAQAVAEAVECRILLSGTPIVSGQTLAGTLSTAGQMDQYTFTANAGDSIDITMGDASAASAVNPQLQLYTPGGTLASQAYTGATNISVGVTYRVPAGGGGTFTAIAQDFGGNNTGAYDVELAVAPANQAPDSDGDGGLIQSGQTKAAQINRPGDLDIYTFNAAAGASFDITMGDASASSAVNPALQVYGPDGALVGNAYTGGTNTSVAVTYRVPAGSGGTYTAVAQDFGGDNTGPYDVELAVAPATQSADSDGDGGPILSGQTKAGQINRPGDLDIYTFAAAAGASFDITMGDASPTSAVNPALQVYGPDGILVGNAYTGGTNTSVGVTYRVPAGHGGTYTAVAQDFGGDNTGAYNVELAVAPATQSADSDGDGGPIQSGQTKTAMINRTGDLDVYTFDAAAGASFDITMGDASAASAVNPELQVYGPDGALVGNAYTGSANTSVGVIYHVPAGSGGTYTAVAQDFGGDNTGAYNVELAVAPATQSADSNGDGGPILSGQTKVAQINRTGDLDVYTFDAAAGASFDITMGDASAASAVNPELQVYGPDGSLVGNAYTGSANTSVGVIYHVPAGSGGTYTAVAQDFGGDNTGAYDVELAVAPAAQQPDADGDGGTLVAGQTRDATINRTGDLDVYTFAAAPGDDVNLTMSDPNATSAVNPELQIYGPDGSLVSNVYTGSANTSVSGIYHVPAAGGGTYTAVAQDFGGDNVGAYRLHLGLTVPAPSVSFNDGATAKDVIAQVQRSEVRTIVLLFAEPVHLIGAALGLELLNTGGSGLNDGSGPTDVTSALTAPTTTDGGLTWLVNFQSAGNSVVDPTHSLVDGIYTLSVDASKLTDSQGNALSGTNLATTFHRLFGDINGYKTVSNTDYFQFRKAFNTSAGQAGFNADFDFSGGGTINNADYFQFRKRFLKQFVY